MPTQAITLQQLPQLFERFGARIEVAAIRGLRSAAARMLPILERATALAPPASPRGRPGAVNTGNYRMQWKAQAKGAGLQGGAGVLVSNSAPYAGVIEYGRRPGRMPPREPIARWAQRKLGLPYKDAKGIAFVIARRIGREGLLPRRVLTSEQTMAALMDALEGEVLHELIEELRNP
jgi:hypothetical protein